MESQKIFSQTDQDGDKMEPVRKHIRKPAGSSRRLQKTSEINGFIDCNHCPGTTDFKHTQLMFLFICNTNLSL